MMELNFRGRNKPKTSIVFILLFFNMILAVFWYCNNTLFYSPNDFQEGVLLKYFNAQRRHRIPWYYLSAYFILNELDNASCAQVEYTAMRFCRIIDGEERLEEFVGRQNIYRIAFEIHKHKAIDNILRGKVFPIDTKACYVYGNDWHYPRTFGGDRKHEGTDILCPKGVAVHTVSDGRVTRLGWNTLGGWRIGITDRGNTYYYYAHLCRYEDGIFEGMAVKKGQIIGYVGDSGYGTGGTTGKFEPHVHFGMYQDNEPFNPYPFLKMWEQIGH